MAITIHFRGVGIFVTDGNQVATEVLLPNADSRHPPDHETIDNEIRHADRSKVKKHYAGVLPVPIQGQGRPRRLLGRCVTFPGGEATRIDARFRRKLPPLQECTNSNGHRLRLLPEDERETDRVATRIVLHGGQLAALDPLLDIEFQMNAHYGTPGPRQEYAYDIVWTTDAASVTLAVRTFDGRDEDPIELSDETTPEAYFYCFDDPNPSKADLTRIDPSYCTGTLTDDDFKWVYQLLDRENPDHRRWQDWLGGDEFPAPWTDCNPRRARVTTKGAPPPLIPVSTCYPTAFDGP